MKQSTALDILKSGANVFLTGSAGAGKTYTLNQYIDYLKARRVAVAVTASTGIAATHMNGMTIHTWSGIGIKNSLETKDLKRMSERKYLVKHLEHAKVLIIDEISMLHAKQLNMVNQVLKYFKETEEAFGGLQVIVSGDFFQLPPVGKSGEANRDKFCFMSDTWVDAGFKVCYLTEQYRQVEEETVVDKTMLSDEEREALAKSEANIPNLSLNDILNQIRSGEVSQDAIDALVSTREQTFIDYLPDGMADDITRLYTHNADVDTINQQQLAKITSKAKVYEAKQDGNEKLLMTLTNSVRAPEYLTLKKGTQVMFVKNNFDQGTYNGTLGEVIGFFDDDEFGTLPEVVLVDGTHIIVTPETWSIDNDSGKAIATYTQLPLCYAWAITVHKSQGMTLEAAEIDLSQTFEAGQGYVALSRLKSLSGLRLLGLNDIALQLDRLAMKADKRFQELSGDIEGEISTIDADELQRIHSAFIIKMGGTNSDYIIGQYGKRKKKGKKGGADYSPSTLEETKSLLEESLTIAEIASKRELAESTIVNHIAKLLKDVPDLPIDHIKPEDELIELVKGAYEKVKKRNKDEDFNDAGDIKLRPIFVALNEDVPYNAIRLALLFVAK